MSDNLNQVVPVVRTVSVSGEVVEVKHIKVGKLSAVMKAVAPLAHLLPKAGDTPQKQPIDFLNIVLNHTEDALNLLGTILEKDKAWVDNLDIDDAVALLTEVVEVNLDFFIQRVLPSVSKAMVRLSGAFIQGSTGQ